MTPEAFWWYERTFFAAISVPSQHEGSSFGGGVLRLGRALFEVALPYENPLCASVCNTWRVIKVRKVIVFSIIFISYYYALVIFTQDTDYIQLLLS